MVSHRPNEHKVSPVIYKLLRLKVFVLYSEICFRKMKVFAVRLHLL